MYIVCINNKCTILLIDNHFFNNLKLKYFTRYFSVVVFVRNIKNNEYLINNYFRLLIYFKDKINNKIIVAYFYREIHIIKNLRAKLLLKIDIINLEYIVVNSNRQKLIIKNCRSLKTKLKIKLKNNIRIKQLIKIEKSLVIITYFVLEILIIIQDKILSNRNYLFKSILLNVYFYIVNKKIFFVYICNNRFVSFCILQYVTLKYLLEFKKQDCYQINFNKKS